MGSKWKQSIAASALVLWRRQSRNWTGHWARDAVQRLKALRVMSSY
ncbi:hypothetical protein [Paenibacillus darwinianus]|nr:hypothetical protein [Paenibacillus darwinianus]